MGLVTGKEILEAAHRGGYAIGAFNINNLEILQGVVTGCVESRSPVIIAVSEGAIQYAGFDYIVAMVRTAAALVPIPMALHLDHGRNHLFGLVGSRLVLGEDLDGPIVLYGDFGFALF